jgi:hypothetical protein
MQRAIQMAKDLEQTIFDLLPTGMSREGAEVDKMAERIKQAGPEGLSRRDFTRAFQGVKSSERDARERTLVRAGTIVPFARQTAGRTAFVFVHKDHLEAHAQQYSGDKGGRL